MQQHRWEEIEQKHGQIWNWIPPSPGTEVSPNSIPKWILLQQFHHQRRIFRNDFNSNLFIVDRNRCWILEMVGNAVLATEQLCWDKCGSFCDASHWHKSKHPNWTKTRNCCLIHLTIRSTMHYQSPITSFQMHSTILTRITRDQEGRVLLGVSEPSSSGPGWLEI